MRKNESDDKYTDEETARRRDDVIRRMANMPRQPHKPIGKKKSRPGRANLKGAKRAT